MVGELEAVELGAPRSMVEPVDQLQPQPMAPKRPPSSRSKPTWALLNCVSQRR